MRKYECKSEIYMTTNLTVATASGKWELYFASCFAAKQTAKNGKEVLRLTILRPFVGKQTDPYTHLCPFKRIWEWILPIQLQISDLRIEDPLRWSLFILFKVIKNQKSSILNTFCPSIKRQNGRPKVVSWLDLSRDIQILDPAIWLWSKHLKTPTN